MTGKRNLPGKPVRPSKADVVRFETLGDRLFGHGVLGDDGVRAAVTALAALRTLQRELGPGHAPFDLIASAVPDAYKRNWAKKLLGKAA